MSAQRLSMLLILLTGIFAACTPSVDPEHPTDDPDNRSAAADDYPTRVFWGDMHLHTANSGDAFAYGARLGPDDALRFAKGEEVVSSTGLRAKLARPLDFLVIADHAEGLGMMNEIYEGNPDLVSDPTMARWRDLMHEGGEAAHRATREIVMSHANGTLPEIVNDPKRAAPIARSIWQAHTDVVERHNEPGEFTAFMGYEYTSVPRGNTLHRVVVFRDGKERADTIIPFSSIQSEDPGELWKFLERYETDTGGNALAIPHNSNLSNGRMFAFVDFEGDRIDAGYARTRARWEPLVEATQIKGDSESHPFLSPNDEFAAFGDAGWELGNSTLQELKTNTMLGGEYVREALKRGLSIEKETGVNPYKFGVIGSTDSHTGLTTADESNFFGKHTTVEPSAERAAAVQKQRDELEVMGWHYLAGGYAAVWSTQNSREALFDAMLRKEVYATTGPRISLRFFGGWDFEPADTAQPGLAETGYSRGVPMGGNLPGQTGNGAPRFLLSALRDPDGANLDRVQIVKGWIDPSGQTHERVHNVAWSNPETRQPDEHGKLPPVEDTVDLTVPSWSDSAGVPELSTVWVDPDFDPAIDAFYYVRVLEIPTPRWSTYDAHTLGVEPREDLPKSIQERAWSSPIWYRGE